jgi:hypothetical protein
MYLTPILFGTALLSAFKAMSGQLSGAMISIIGSLQKLSATNNF